MYWCNMVEFLFFEEIGFDPLDYSEQDRYREAVQLAGDYLMDGKYAEHSELDVINWADASVDWTARQVVIPVKQVYNPHVLQ